MGKQGTFLSGLNIGGVAVVFAVLAAVTGCAVGYTESVRTSGADEADAVDVARASEAIGWEYHGSYSIDCPDEGNGECSLRCRLCSDLGQPPDCHNCDVFPESCRNGCSTVCRCSGVA